MASVAARAAMLAGRPLVRVRARVENSSVENAVFCGRTVNLLGTPVILLRPNPPRKGRVLFVRLPARGDRAGELRGFETLVAPEAGILAQLLGDFRDLVRRACGFSLWRLRLDSLSAPEWLWARPAASTTPSRLTARSFHRGSGSRSSRRSLPRSQSALR